MEYRIQKKRVYCYTLKELKRIKILSQLPNRLDGYIILQFFVKCKCSSPSFLRSFASLPRTASDYCVIFVVLATLIHSVISLRAFNKYRSKDERNQEKTGN
nr:MAG TPA: hypothetical protein [Caudoviricetes sp.]